DQVIGNANRRVESLSLRIKRERETSRAHQTIPVHVYHPPEPTARSSLQQANDLITKGTSLLAMGDFRGSRAPFEEALRILESGTEAESAESQWQLARFNLYNDLAKAALKSNEPDEALAVFTKCLAFVQDRAAAEPKTSEWRRRRAVLHQKIGELHGEQGRLVEARSQYREATALWRELASVPELLPVARRGLAFSLAQLGDLELKRPNTELAVALSQESVSLLRLLSGSFRPGPHLQQELSVRDN